MNMNRTYTGIVIVLIMLPLISLADDNYYTAEQLADDCVSKNSVQEQLCFGVMHGVLGSVAFLRAAHSPFANTLCIPATSTAIVKGEFLSAFYAQRQRFTGMAAGAAVTSVLYDRYPCEAEKQRRKQEAEEAYKDEMNHLSPNQPH